MHRDKTTGLALAILLIGFVSSLCFPRQSDEPEEEETPLKHEAIIQKRIDEGVNRPYSPPGVDLKGVESVSDETVVEVDHLGNAKSASAGGWEFPDSESTVHTESPGRSLTQEPSEASNPNQLVPIPVPAHNEDWESQKTVSGTNRESTEVTPASRQGDGFVVHKVERGDTLSSLGARYLGSSARFMEIFEANRDTLKSPGAIYVGMKLRIPSRERSSKSVAKPNSKKASESAAKEESKRTAKGRFVPARRNPFRAGQAIPRESASLEGKQIPIKKLSQVPPEKLESN